MFNVQVLLPRNGLEISLCIHTVPMHCGAIMVQMHCSAFSKTKGDNLDCSTCKSCSQELGSDSHIWGCRILSFTVALQLLVENWSLLQLCPKRALPSRTFASQVFTEISTHQDYSIVGLILKQVFTEISTHQDSSIVGLIFPHKP